MNKIMFTDVLTEAVKEGRKTNTRREESALKKAIKKYEAIYHVPFSFISQYYDSGLERLVMRTPYEPLYFKPRFLPGEVVAIAQSYSAILDELETPGNFVCMEHWEAASGKRAHYADLIRHPGFGNKMFVSADEMLHQIRISGVRIERMQDISEEDCLREGIRTLTSAYNPTHYTFDGWKFKNNVNRCSDTPREAFSCLINKVSGKGTWERNPWNVVYDFELVK